MMFYPHQGRFVPLNRRFPNSRQRVLFRHDRFFHLPTVIAQNDPFLRRLYSVVSLILDDHPYPATPQQFSQRTQEIKYNVAALNLAPDQMSFLDRLMKETGVTLVDLWQGSHIITLDNGYLYDLWSQLPISNPRGSSHYRQIPLKQYGINFFDHQLLFGKTDINGSTWFQMEAHGFDAQEILNDPNLALYHGQDFLKYRINKMNVGPFGFSPHTEMSNPIILPYQPLKIKTKQRLKPKQRQRRVDRSRYRF